MKYLVIILLIIGADAHAQSLETWQKAVLKVESFPCALGEPVFAGTGILVHRKGKVGLLSSDHIFYQHKNQETCVRAYNQYLELELLEPKNIDFLNGLAWLETSKLSRPEIAVSLDGDFSSSRKYEYVALGFPISSSQLSRLHGGEFKSLTSGRALIPNVSQFYEIGNIPIAVSYTHLTLPTNREV